MNIEKLKNDKRMPKHIAFIIDGNGRWAKKRGLTRSFGHKVGFDNLKTQIENVYNLGIKNCSVYCFSKENWNRPEKEVNYLMELFDKALDDYKKDYLEKDIRLVISGDMEDERLPLSVRTKAKELMELTKNKQNFVINLCINYGGRQEILNAVNNIIKSGEKDIDVEKFTRYLYTAELLPVDFIIRTSGEFRTSNFFPWQSTYSEWYFPKINWPAFSKRDLIKALNNFIKRNRRFGAIKG